MPSDSGITLTIDWLRQQTSNARDQRHPLISRQLETHGLDLFTERFGQLVNINRDGQFAMREMLSGALRRIERDAQGIPIKLYPYCCISLYFAQLSRILPRDELVPVPRYSGRGQLRCRAARRQIMTHGRSALAKQSFCAAADATQSHQGRLM